MRVHAAALLIAGLLVAGCSSESTSTSLYDNNMEKGKDAYIANDFESAIAYFSEAKQLKPTPEANELLNKAIAQSESRAASTAQATEERVPDLDALVGEWGQVRTDRAGYHYMNIQKVDSRTMTVFMESTQDPPVSRTASIEVDATVEGGALHFRYDDDGWGNQGQGTIKLKDGQSLEVTLEETYSNPDAGWSLHNGGAWPRITEEMKQQAAAEAASPPNANALGPFIDAMNAQFETQEVDIRLDANAVTEAPQPSGYLLEYGNVSIAVQFGDDGIQMVSIMEGFNDKVSGDFFEVVWAAIRVADAAADPEHIVPLLLEEFAMDAEQTNAGSATITENGRPYMLVAMDMREAKLDASNPDYHYTFVIGQ